MKEEAREKTSGFQACYHATYTRVPRQGYMHVCLYRAPNMIEKHSTSTCVYRALRTIRRKSRDARSHGPPEATDGSTDKRPQSHYVRERNTPASTGSLTATLTYYRSLTIGNRRRIVRTVPLTLRDPLDANGTRMIRAFLRYNLQRY